MILARKILVVLGVALTFALYFAHRCRFALIQIDDKSLIARWSEDRESLNSLVILSSRGLLGKEPGSVVRQVSESGDSLLSNETEIHRICSLLNSKYPGSDYSVVFDEHWSECRVIVPGTRRLKTWDQKGYVYLLSPPLDEFLRSDLDSISGTRSDTIYYRRLDKHWYIFLSRW